MKSMTEKICIMFSMIFMAVALFFCGYCYNRTKVAEARLMEIGCSLRKEMKETEEKCQRYSDACINILSSGVWINGDNRD